MTNPQTPPGELAPTVPPPEHTGARPAVPTPPSAGSSWQPGDPLYPRSSYRQGLFTFRIDGDGWGDAAQWHADGSSTPIDRHLAVNGDELGDFIAEWHAWDRAGRPEAVSTDPDPIGSALVLLFSARVRHLVHSVVEAVREDEAAADRLRTELGQQVRR